MNVQDIIDSALSQGDNVPASDAAYIDRRRRARALLTEVFNETWWLRDWPFRKAEYDVTVPAGQGYVAAPSRFESLGNYGEVFRLEGGAPIFPPLEQVNEAVLMESRTGNHTSSYPRIYSLFGQDPVDHRVLIQIPLNSVDVELRVFCQRKPPKLLDAGDPEQPVYTVSITRSGTTATVTTTQAHRFEHFDRVVIAGATQPEYNGTFEITVTGALTFTYTVSGSPATPATGTITATPDVATGNLALNEIEYRFHTSVLLPGLKAKLRESKGDARWKNLRADYLQGQKDMKKELVRGQGQPGQLPSFFGDRKHTGPY